jgi:ribose transport system substrate-binding protein
MKLLYKIALLIFILVVVVSAALILFYFNKVNSVYGNEDAYVFGNNPKHLSLILNSEDEEYWQEYKEGVVEAGKAYNTAVEFNSIIEPDSNGKTVEYINIANKSRVNGIIVNGKNTYEYLDAIDNAAQSGINVVVGQVESVNSDGLFYVGTNFYDYGAKAAALIAEAGGGKTPVNLAVIQESDGTDAQSNNTMGGLNSEIGSGRKINILCAPSRNNDLLGAEDLTRNILTEHPDVDVIFCMNAKDTVATARVIVERNLVGDVVIVGTDVTDEIVYFINIGVIFGVLDRNGHDAGYRSVEVLNKAGNMLQTDYVYVDSDIFTSFNIKQINKQGVK